MQRHDAALIAALKGGGHVQSGPLLRAQPKQAILRKTRPRPVRSSARWSRAAILSSCSRRAAAAAAAAIIFAIFAWAGMATARDEAPPNLSHTSTSGSYLAARHANG